MCYELEGPWWRGLFRWIQLRWECCLQHWRRWKGMLWGRAATPGELVITRLMSCRSDLVECCNFTLIGRWSGGPQRKELMAWKEGMSTRCIFLTFYELLLLLLLSLSGSLQNRINTCAPFASDQKLFLPHPIVFPVYPMEYSQKWFQSLRIRPPKRCHWPFCVVWLQRLQASSSSTWEALCIWFRGKLHADLFFYWGGHLQGNTGWRSNTAEASLGLLKTGWC